MKAIFFDLDGTLLPMDTDKFMKMYFHEMSKVFTGVMEPKELLENVMSATNSMVKDLTDRSNEEVFMAAFEEKIDGNIEKYRALWDEFYQTGYKNVRNSSYVSQQMQESIAILKKKGYRLIIATNPLFPKDAILQRIEWAGVSADDFEYISSFEQNHYCKPQLSFYNEILESLNLEAEDCLMVGNDVQEDMIVSAIGMKTYLIENHMQHRNEKKIEVDYRGDYESFLSFVKEIL
ncbi:MAG: HAD family hydrolase [Clostridiales bacterium]|nr:HAD family hydrolase [Clostridiales bacterium]